METLLCKVKLGLVGRQLCQLLPLLLAAGLLCKPVGSVKVPKLDGQVKPVEGVSNKILTCSSKTQPVLWITANSESLLLEALLLQEMSDAGSLLLWHRWQHLVCSVEIPAW